MGPPFSWAKDKFNKGKEAVKSSSVGKAMGDIASKTLSAGKKGLATAKTTMGNVWEAGTNALWPFKPTGYKTTKEEALDGLLDLRWSSVVYEKVQNQAGWEANTYFPKRYKGKCVIENHAGSGQLGYMIIANCHDKLWAVFRGTQNQKDAEADIKSAVLSTF